VTAVHWTAEVLAPSVVAVVFLGDTVRPGWGPAATIAGLVTVGAAVVLASAPATNATAHAPEALPAGPPRPALPAPPQPAHDRIIWWGAPPIWKPPARAKAIQPAQPRAELPWSPPRRPRSAWADARPPRHYRAAQPPKPYPAARPPSPYPAALAPAGRSAQLRPWHDLQAGR
jgi:hypothetical protein